MIRKFKKILRNYPTGIFYGVMSYYPVLENTGQQRRKKGKLVWLIDILVSGLPRYQTRYRGTRTEIARLETKIREDMEQRAGRGIHGRLKDPTFAEYADYYLEYVKSFQKSWRTTASRVHNFLRFLAATDMQDKRLSEFSTTDVIDYMRWRRGDIPPNKSSKPPGEVTIKRDVVCFRTMISLAVKSVEYKINYDFVAPIKLVREEPKFEEGLTVEQYHKLVDAAVDYLKPVIEFGAYTGWRQSEITNLRLRRVKIYDVGGLAILEDSKNDQHRMTTLPPDLIDTLKQLPSWDACPKCQKGEFHTDEDCVFVFTRGGKRILRFDKALKNAYRAAGLLPIFKAAKPFHRLRNFFRTNHAEIGTDIGVIMREGGWKDAQMMIRYLNRRKSLGQKTALAYAEHLKKGGARIVELQKKAGNAEQTA